MANLKEIRTRIASVGANMKITQAMKMVSASKFKSEATKQNLRLFIIFNNIYILSLFSIFVNINLTNDNRIS